MKNLSKRNTIITLSVLIFITAWLLFGQNTKTPPTLKCPESFPETDAGYEERLAAMNEWTNDFYDSHPNSSLSEWGEARHQFYRDNGCAKSLEKYEQAKAGKADPAVMKTIDNAIQETINNNP
ncbi:MAG: hypothetical protein HYT94_04890 [Parcubacteria group bacterium]|nr:hypothetical protein [Parcubacteria group bacterium]